MRYRARLVDEFSGRDESFLVELCDGPGWTAEQVVDAIDKARPLAGKAGWWLRYRIRHFVPLPTQLRLELEPSNPMALMDLRRLTLYVDLFGKSDHDAAQRSGSKDEIRAFRQRAEAEVDWLSRALASLRRQEQNHLAACRRLAEAAPNRRETSLRSLDWLAAEVAVLEKRKELRALLTACPNQRSRGRAVRMPSFAGPQKAEHLRFPDRQAKAPRPVVASPFARRDTTVRGRRETATAPSNAPSPKIQSPDRTTADGSTLDGTATAAMAEMRATPDRAAADYTGARGYDVSICRADGRVKHVTARLNNLESADAILRELAALDPGQAGPLGGGKTGECHVTAFERDNTRIRIKVSPPPRTRFAMAAKADGNETLITVDLLPSIRDSADHANEPAIAAAARRWAPAPPNP